MRIAICFLLVLALSSGMCEKAPGWTQIPCAQAYDSLKDSQGQYDNNIYVLYTYVIKQLEAQYPGSSWDYLLGCNKAEVLTGDANHVKFRIDYNAVCNNQGEDADFAKYPCDDANNARVGDLGVFVTFDAVCAKGWAAWSNCAPSNMAVTVTQGPLPPTSTPPGKWVVTNPYSIPSVVITAAKTKILELSPWKRVGPPSKIDFVIPSFNPSYKLLRKEDGQGNVVYRINALAMGPSLAGKACFYPYLYQYPTVELGYAKGGAISFPQSPVVFRKMLINDGKGSNILERVKCTHGTGPKGAAYKKAVAKAQAFIKTLPKSQGGTGPGK